MGFQCGIVGLPNVGKSTLFNALTETAAASAANYPFCTIDPNIGQVPVPDPRLQEIARLAKSQKVIETQLAFVDIAGLVRDASKGEGLGNQFLGNIREVNAIIHVVRCFEDDDITHVDDRVDPIADATTVETELMLADLESVEKRIDALNKKARGGDKESASQLAFFERAQTTLSQGKPARQIPVDNNDPEEAQLLSQSQLLTAKPILYVCNVDEESAASGNRFSEAIKNKASSDDAAVVIISAKIESEIAQMEKSERLDYLDAIGLHETGLNRVIHAGYRLLDLISFFTAGPKEARAWTVHRQAKAPEAAGVIHTDFQKGFIRAETVSYDDYIAHGGEQGARDAGKMRLEGKEYCVQDGDVMLFRFNV